jgi:hypothetical protein
MFLVQCNVWQRFRTWFQTDWTTEGTAKWDTTKAWNAKGQPHGIVAADVPALPLCVRYEEVVNGRINHAMGFAPPGYAADKVGPARHHDGNLDPAIYPLRAGERLRLRREIVDATEDPAVRVFAEAAWEFGLILIDKKGSANQYEPWDGEASFPITQDVRWQQVNFPEWDLSDFEVIAQ